jgi:tRNA U38,U39,U40 pseudouridine synthase TruA
VGLKKLGKSEFAELLNSGVRKHPVLKAPPGGLYLKDVRY